MLTLLARKTTSQDVESQRQYAYEIARVPVHGRSSHAPKTQFSDDCICRFEFGDACQSPSDGSQASAALLGFSKVVGRILRLHHHDLAALLLNLSDIVICQSAVKLDSGRKVTFHKLELLPANSK